MKRLAYVIAIAVLACAAPAFAQGAFNDVPADHWAYEAVDTLQQHGALIGYPDGTFSGKRTITRYEFATAVARIIQMMPDTAKFATKEELASVSASIKPAVAQTIDTSKFATKGDLDRIAKLVDAFRDELAALGVDVDSVKRSVDALEVRVAAIEEQMKKWRWTGDMNVFTVVSQNNYGSAAVDLDNRTIADNSKLLETISLVKDLDITITGQVNQNTTAVATLNYGNYLNYLGQVDSYAGGVRPTSAGGNSTVRNSLSDNFFPYYLYIDTVVGPASVTVGRFPIQFTPYTLKKIDVDSYTTIVKTDDGNYPVDGIKAGLSFAGVDMTLFAAKHDTNDYLALGLAGQPNAGLGVLHQQTVGNSVGGLAAATQSAGVRVTKALPWNISFGATYYQTWESAAVGNLDQARVYGADVAVPVLKKYNLVGSWTKSDTMVKDGAPAQAADVSYQNTAWDGKVATGFGKLGVSAGYKSIGRNFAAAGAWDKLGRWTNPVNVKGPYAAFSYPVMGNLCVDVNGEYLTWIDDTVTAGTTAGFGAKDDKIIKAEAGLKWLFSKVCSLNLGYEMIKWSPDAAAKSDATESYATVGLAHQLGANANMKIGYQVISYDDGDTFSGPYAADYRAGLGVVQFGVTF